MLGAGRLLAAVLPPAQRAAMKVDAGAHLAVQVRVHLSNRAYPCRKRETVSTGFLPK